MYLSLIRTRLLADAAVSALVSRRVYIAAVGAETDATYPCVILTDRGGEPTLAHGGQVAAVQATLDVASWAATREVAWDLGYKVQASLGGWRARTASLAIEAVVPAEQALDFRPGAEDESGLFRATLAFICWYIPGGI